MRVIAFGAHPDDCDLGAGGLAAKYAALGFKVKFVSLTNGDAGHQTQGGEALAKRRRAEAQEAGRRIGIEYEVLDNHDGKLLPTLDVREQVIREIRQIYDNYEFDTEILAASIRSANHVKEAALIGADVVTAPPSVLKSLVKHPLTDKGIDMFLADWKKTGQSI